jgi:hypothetical protein
MKKQILIAILVVSTSVFAQKKKKTVKTETQNVIAKTDNVSAEIAKNNMYVFANNGKSKDTISVKPLGTSVPAEAKMVAFNTKNNKLYMVTWIEKNMTKTVTKTEIATIVNSEIYDIATKTKVFENKQTATNIKEQVFLDKLKNASETQERNRNEGFVVTLLPDGDLSLKTKTQDSKMTYDVVAKKYSIKKK